MKVKIISILSIVIILCSLVAITYATNEMNLNIQSKRPYNDDNIDGIIGNDVYKFERDLNAFETIWKIYEVSNESNKFSKSFYCLRGGLGFGSGSATATETKYTKIGNMETEVQTVLEKYKNNTSIDLDKSYSTILNGTSYSFTPYNAILWIGDNMYLPENIDAEDMKLKLLQKSEIVLLTDEQIENIEEIIKDGLTGNEENELKEIGFSEKDITNIKNLINSNTTNIMKHIKGMYELTDDDIEAIQQMAIWYFSNYDKNNNKDFSLAMSSMIDNKIIITTENQNTNYNNISKYSDRRANNMKKLYEYFRDNAIRNSLNYGTGNNRIIEAIEPTITIEETNPKIEQSGNFYVVGPFKVSKTEGNKDYTIDQLELKDAKGVKIEQNVSGVPIYSIIQKKTDTTVYKSSLENTIGAEDFYIKISSTFSRSYDLGEISLNLNYSGKYYNTVATLWTATNSDQPILMVEKEKKTFSGQDVINTKEITGKLKLLINKVDEKDNTIISDSAKFTINKEGNARTDYYTTSNNLSTGTVDGTIEIQETIMSTGTFVYEIQEDEAPEGYTGISNKLYVQVTTGLNSAGTEYEVKTAKLVKLVNGVYTETMVEGVVLSLNSDKATITIKVANNKIKYFDLALRKYITKVNGVVLSEADSRIPNIVETDLKEEKETTATYNHKKSPVIINTGDIVTYNITVYNEGEIAGKATKVVDQLPTGLEFVEVVSGEYTANYDRTTNKVMFTETNANENLAEYDGKTLSKTTIEIRCKVVAQVTNSNQILTNISWISEDYNAESNTITDRDSRPTVSPEVNKDNIVDYTGKDNKSDLTDSTYYYKGQQDDDDFEKLILKGKYFDLALRKYITKLQTSEGKIKQMVNSSGESNTRTLTNIDVSPLNTGSTTANYKHRKEPIVIETGDVVTYSIKIYNEGYMAGRAKKVVDQLPEGLEFIEVVSGNYEVEEYNKETNKVTLNETMQNTDLEAYNNETLSSTTIEIKCKVVAKVTNNDQILTNVAWISEDYNAENNAITDRDSSPTTVPEVNKNNMVEYTGNDNKSDLTDSEYYYKGQEDDDDFEKLILKGEFFDLSLRKYIVSINGEELKGEEERVPKIDASELESEKATTATYSHSKDPIVVKKGDIVTYKIRVYNEGKRNGYATEITDYLPEGLGLLLNYNTNLDNLWHIDSKAKTIGLIGEDGFYSTEDKVKNLKVDDFSDIVKLSDVKIAVGELKVTTKTLDDEIIKAYNKETTVENIEENEKWQQSTKGKSGLYYQEVEVACIVLKDNTYTGTLTNIAEISKAEDENGNQILNQGDDRDSVPNNVDTKNYNPPENNSSYQEDDDDYEPVVLKYFDFALRKFITKIESTDITTRIPEVSVDKDGNVTYYHDKTPLYVANSDIVTYTIRIYNEGSIDGYAEIVSDDIPEGLEFLPNNETNKKYIWKMYYEEDGKFVETEDIEKATSIRTTYLSKANGEITNIIREDGTEQKNGNLLKGFDRTKMEIPDYRDVEVAFKVVEKDIPETNADRIIINKAQISEDSDDDEDSITDEWNEGEDDQDKEYIYVKEFDLSLLKWVTTTVVTVDGKATTTQTGFTPNIGKTEYTSDTFEKIRNNETVEPIAKVELDRKKLKSTTVKFLYKIRVTNEGELEGYATEITDYIPEGLEFVAEDNPIWKKVGDDKVTTRALETTLLKPGESTEIEIVFKWINNASNLGQKINIAEISEDYNEKGEEDIDSVPDTVNIKTYNKEIEDDDDYALVLLSLKTGENNVTIGYTCIAILSLAILTTGVILIKKYVL